MERFVPNVIKVIIDFARKWQISAQHDITLSLSRSLSLSSGSKKLCLFCFHGLTWARPVYAKTNNAKTNKKKTQNNSALTFKLFAFLSGHLFEYNAQHDAYFVYGWAPFRWFTVPAVTIPPFFLDLGWWTLWEDTFRFSVLFFQHFFLTAVKSWIIDHYRA